MPLIEGVGDEVVEFFIGLVIVVIGIAAWWSTRIADRPLIRTVVVFERRSQTIQHNQSTSSSEPRPVQDQRDYVQDLNVTPPQEGTEPDSEENKPPRAGSSVEPPRVPPREPRESREPRDPPRRGSGDASNSDELEEQNAIVESMDNDANVLRRRRLEFFQPSLACNYSNDDVNTATSDRNDLNDLDNVDNEDVSRADSTDTTETTLDEDDIRIKLKYINDDLKMVNGKLQEPLGDFKRRHFSMELSSDKLVRLIFNGQVLQRDDVTLQSCGLFDNCVVHCLVHQKRSSVGDRSASSGSLGTSGASPGSSPTVESLRTRLGGNPQQGRDWDLGNLFFAIVSFVLGAAWYFRYEYAQLYTVTATVALVGLTGIFTVLLVGMYFPDSETPVQTVRS